MKQKKFLAAFLAAAMTVACLPQAVIAEPLMQKTLTEGVPQEAEPLSAGDRFTDGDFEYEELEDGTLSITGYEGTETKVTIPSQINGQAVTEIGDRAFYYCSSLTEITLPNSVTKIDDGAFSSCNSLAKVTLPDGLKTMGSNAFYYCSSLTEITLPAGLTVIENGTFSSCYKLASVKLPNNVTEIGERAFSDCSSLTEINLPNSVTIIGDYAFFGCYKLTEINIPNSVTVIGERAFYRCTSLAEITISDNVEEIGKEAFVRCTNLTSINVKANNKYFSSTDGILFNKDVTTLILYPCGKDIDSYAVPNGVTTIEDGAFYWCDFLSEITFPDSLKKIGANAFASCGKLTRLQFPESVEEIGEGAFNGCSELQSVKLPSALATLNDDVFANCGKLNKIDFPASLTTIQYRAFGNCSSLTSVELPETLTSIGPSAFWNSGLKAVTIPKNTAAISTGVFGRCSSLTDITVEENNNFFKSDDGILFTKDGSVIVAYPAGKSGDFYAAPDSTVSIQGDAFMGSALKTVFISDSVTEIGTGVFSNCGSLTSVILSEGITKIPDAVFEFCPNLKSVYIPAGVTNIAYRAFSSWGSPDLTIYGHTGSAAQTYADNNRIPFSSLNEFTDSKTGIEMTAGENSVPTGSQLNAEQTEKTETSLTYSITLTKNGKEIQPEGEVIVRIPVPEGWDTENIYVYHRDANGRLTEIKATVSGGYIIFTTNHFSEYVISTKKLVTTTPCDVDGSGEVDELDSVALARYLASWNVAIDQSAADVDGNGDIDELDSVMLARKLAGWNV